MGEDAVTVMQQELIPVIRTDYLAQLLQRPGGRRMSCDVAVNQAAASMLDDHEHVQHAEAGCDGETEITGEDSLGMQAQERRPAQVPSGAARRAARHVFAHGAGGDLKIQLQ